MQFLLETEEGMCRAPSQSILLRGLEYLDWLNQGTETGRNTGRNNRIVSTRHAFIDITALTEASTEKYQQWRAERICPMGSLEFVHRFYKIVYDIELKPINIPTQLCIPKFLNRPYCVIDTAKNQSVQDIFGEQAIYLKSRESIRHIFNGRYPTCKDVRAIADLTPLTDGGFQATGELDFVSEWRCFILEGKLHQTRCYQGDEWTLPSKDIIGDMIEAYTDCPPAYTLDVGVDRDGKTSIIECHDFYSVGLYGYEDYVLLPFMYWRSHVARIQNRKEKTNGIG